MLPAPFSTTLPPKRCRICRAAARRSSLTSALHTRATRRLTRMRRQYPVVTVDRLRGEQAQRIGIDHHWAL